jgi:hypothetical protein
MEDTQEQSNNRPWLFKKGQPSANPGGRPKGSKSLKTRAREYLEGLSDEESIEYFEGLNKLDVWKMAEGMPETKGEVGVKGDLTISIAEAINTKYANNPTSSPESSSK